MSSAPLQVTIRADGFAAEVALAIAVWGIGFPQYRLSGRLDYEPHAGNEVPRDLVVRDKDRHPGTNAHDNKDGCHSLLERSHPGAERLAIGQPSVVRLHRFPFAVTALDVRALHPVGPAVGICTSSPPTRRSI